jgi:methylmalonyl-CoA mutase C-terminal domain/subunit
MGKRKIRVLIAKVGLDGHDRGAKIVARSLMDAGMEVIYTGLRQTAEDIATAAVQENTMVIAGGIILKHQIAELKKMGVQEVFLPGIPPAEIASYIQENLNK